MAGQLTKHIAVSLDICMVLKVRGLKIGKLQQMALDVNAEKELGAKGGC